MIVGFIFMAVLNSFHLFNLGGFHLAQGFNRLAGFLIVMTMAGIGMNTRAKQLFQGGGRALLVGLLSMLVLMSISLVLVHLFL